MAVRPLVTMKTSLLILAYFSTVLFFPRLACAGTLDDAPFRVIVPGAGWQIEDSTAQPMGKDVFLAATISKTNTHLKSVIIKTLLAKQTESALDELCAGIRDTLANPVVKRISETDVTFLGYAAKAFTYVVTQGSQSTYNQAIIFVAEGKGWTIALVGRPEQKDEIKKMTDFFSEKSSLSHINQKTRPALRAKGPISYQPRPMAQVARAAQPSRGLKVRNPSSRNPNGRWWSTQRPDRRKAGLGASFRGERQIEPSRVGDRRSENAA